MANGQPAPPQGAPAPQDPQAAQGQPPQEGAQGGAPGDASQEIAETHSKLLNVMGFLQAPGLENEKAQMQAVVQQFQAVVDALGQSQGQGAPQAPQPADAGVAPAGVGPNPVTPAL